MEFDSIFETIFKPDSRNKDILPNSQTPQGISRRNFLKILGLTALGTSIEFNSILKAFPRGANHREQELGNEQRETMLLSIDIKEVPYGEHTFLQMADNICLFEGVRPPNPDEISTSTPEDRHYRSFFNSENLKFRDKPPFLIIHTMGGSLSGGLQHMNQRNIHCQFAVGRNPNTGRVESFQLAPLSEHYVNVSGTTSGGEINPPSLNNQFWESLNIEIEGHPNNIEEEALDKAVELVVKLIKIYNLKISQIIGHLEVPNNGKGDPGRTTLKAIRTKVYIQLLTEGCFHLLDIHDDGDLDTHFDTISSPSGPAQANSEGRPRCWVSQGNFVDWDEIQQCLSENPNIQNNLTNYRNDPNHEIQIVINKESDDLKEVYMGFPPDLASWLIQERKPLGPKDNEIFGIGEATFVSSVIRFLRNITNNQQLNGMSLPFSYENARMLARLYNENRPEFYNPHNQLARAIVLFSNASREEKINYWHLIRDYIINTHNIKLPEPISSN